MPAEVEEPPLGLTEEAYKLVAESIALANGLPVEALIGEPLHKRVADVARKLYEHRVKTNTPGCAADDWRNAEIICEFISVNRANKLKPEALKSKARFLVDREQRKEVEKNLKFLQERRVSQLRISVPTEDLIRAYPGCAATTVALLTGWHLAAVGAKLQPPDNACLKPEEMCEMLKGAGVETTNLDDLLYPADRVYLDALSPLNVILVCFRTTKSENSWGVCWNGMLYHNLKPEPINSTTWLHKLPLARYLVWRDDWRSDDTVKTTLINEVTTEAERARDPVLIEEAIKLPWERFEFGRSGRVITPSDVPADVEAVRA